MTNYFKTVTDPVHGNIGLSQVEAEVMTSSVMQRLHNVRQLGLAHLVYPGANYSRFAHSVGACHNASNLLNAISRNTQKAIDPRLHQEYRLVALLHDVGHYPFSHATETVVDNYYAQSIVVKDVESVDSTAIEIQSGEISSVALTDKNPPPQSYHHEPLGDYIIRNDPEIGEILNRHGYNPQEIADRFSKAKPDQLIGIISSDLDCDRLDYLKRTAHNSGAPYGSVDVRFLIDQATTDSEGIFCFKGKATRAADHLLVSRFYDYMQVPFNKTVAALEWSLVRCLEALLKNGTLDCSGSAIEQRVKSGSWKHFDDQHVFELFRKLLHQTSGESVLHDHLLSILDRKPAKLLAGWDEVISTADTRNVVRGKYIARKLLKDVVSELGLDADRFHIWETPVRFTKVDRQTPIESQNEEHLAEAVQVLDERTGKAELLILRRNTLVHHLCSYRMEGLRLYYLPENGELDPATKQKIVSRFEDALGQPVM